MPGSISKKHYNICILLQDNYLGSAINGIKYITNVNCTLFPVTKACSYTISSWSPPKMEDLEPFLHCLYFLKFYFRLKIDLWVFAKHKNIKHYIICNSGENVRTINSVTENTKCFMHLFWLIIPILPAHAFPAQTVFRMEEAASKNMSDLDCSRK